MDSVIVKRALRAAQRMVGAAKGMGDFIQRWARLLIEVISKAISSGETWKGSFVAMCKNFLRSLSATFSEPGRLIMAAEEEEAAVVEEEVIVLLEEEEDVVLDEGGAVGIENDIAVDEDDLAVVEDKEIAAIAPARFTRATRSRTNKHVKGKKRREAEARANGA